MMIPNSTPQKIKDYFESAKAEIEILEKEIRIKKQMVANEIKRLFNEGAK